MKGTLSQTYSAALVGIHAKPVQVEVDAQVGMSSFTIVGLADKSVKESKERISSAIKNIDASPPNKQNRRVTVNLAPANMPKAGSAFDLAIAIGYLEASQQLTSFDSESIMFAGELALDGSLRPVYGALAIAKAAKKNGFSKVILPTQNAPEAAIIDIDIIPADTIEDVVFHLEGSRTIKPHKKTTVDSLRSINNYFPSIVDILGQESAKRALEIAAAGGHNILLHGPPGAGKTMLAKAIRSILPPMNARETIEVTEIYSAVGLTSTEKNTPVIVKRPFRSPHHTASPASIIGGGTKPRPGEISLAHRGVLFLDELPEFRRDVLEALRQPLEEGVVHISRAKQSLSLPANFMFIASMNPCPCGHHGDKEKDCVCGPHEVSRYQKRLSGPLLDRIDMHIRVPRIDPDKIIHGSPPENTAARLEIVRKRIEKARILQAQRYSNISASKKTNADISSRDVRKFIKTDAKTVGILKTAVEKGLLSMRGYYRMLKIAQTIADLETSEIVASHHIAEALQHRSQLKKDLQ